MKTILGLDLGTTSIGWALVKEAEKSGEESSIIKLGVRVNPLTTDELKNFEEGKSITTNAERTQKRSMRRNLQRYKLRRENLKEILIANGWIGEKTILSEFGNQTTFETYRLRARAATEEITLEQLARVLLMINKKRGYKSARKVKSTDQGELIDGMSVAKILYEENRTPGQYVYRLLQKGSKSIPDFYRSDLQSEFERIWDFQKNFYPEILTEELKARIPGLKKGGVAKIFREESDIYMAENKGANKKTQPYRWRAEALEHRLSPEELAFVISDLNDEINRSSGYLGSISDRSKELYFNKQTVGQALMAQLQKDAQASLKNQVFYRQDYLDEFEIIWQRQAKGRETILTDELKHEIRDVVIFYQRRLKSQKGLVSFCEFESREIEVEIDGKKKKKRTGSKVCPKSSPLFQEFKIWQTLNNIQLIEKESRIERFLQQEEMELLHAELSLKNKLSRTEILKLLCGKSYKQFDLNYEEINGNTTQSTLYRKYNEIAERKGFNSCDFSKMKALEIEAAIHTFFTKSGYETGVLRFDPTLEGEALEQQPMFLLWHLLYSYEGDNSNTGKEKLIRKLMRWVGLEREYAEILAQVTFAPEYGSLSAKAIRKIIPHLQEGFAYAGRKERPDEPSACEYAGYRHSAASLTKEEMTQKILEPRLTPLSKNSLRNPVVEKILNQMVNVVNGLIDTYGKPDEIRIELARELKKSAKERKQMNDDRREATSINEKYKKILQEKFHLPFVSRNDIIRYKLYQELAQNGYKTLYSDTYIPEEKLFTREFDIEHIIPRARLFDDSFSNKTLEKRDINARKGAKTAFDFISEEYGAESLDAYEKRLDHLLQLRAISATKYKKLKMQQVDIPSDFIERDLRDTQYIARVAREMLGKLVRPGVVSTTGSITNRLREDWQLVDVMKELNWTKYDKIGGLTEIRENRDGQKIQHILGWSKRNDHRHHAMDALTIAFTKPAYIQYLNHLNARDNETDPIANAVKEIERNCLSPDKNHKLRFNAPIQPLTRFRCEAKQQLENILISIKAKNKVFTSNLNITRKNGGVHKTKQLTPRGQLHKETVYGCNSWSWVKLDDKINRAEIAAIRDPQLRKFIEEYLAEKKSIKVAFSPENLDELFYKGKKLTQVIINKPCYTQRIDIGSFFTNSQKTHSAKESALDSIIDPDRRKVLKQRWVEYGEDFNKAFTNLEENPVWMNREKKIAIKHVTIEGVQNAESLHRKVDKDGMLLLDENGNYQPIDFVSIGNNHHAAIYRDEEGKLQDEVVSFFQAVAAKKPFINKEYRRNEGWTFLFSMKQNEYFVFPNAETGFEPRDIDLSDPDNYPLISPNLFRVQVISKTWQKTSFTRDYIFRHHLETSVNSDKALSNLTYKRIRSLLGLEGIVKVRIDAIGRIVSVGEY